MTYRQEKQRFTNFPPTTIEDAKHNVNLLIELEKIRMEDVIDKHIRSGKPVIMDRCFLSTIVFEYAISRQFLDRINVLDYTIVLFKEQTQAKKLFIPSVLVYLEPFDYQVFVERIEKRGKVGINFLNEFETVKIMQHWYRHILSANYPDNSSLIIQSTQGGQKETAKSVNEFLNTVNYTNNTNKIFL